MNAKRVTLTAMVVFAFCAIATAAPILITNGNFSDVPITCGGYAYQYFGGNCNSNPPQQDFNGTQGFGWTLIIKSGIGLTAPNSAFQPPDFTGLPFTQALFLQDGASTAYQALGGFSANTNYVLSFYIGSRYAEGGGDDGNQTVQVTMDGVALFTISLKSFTPFMLEEVPFSVPTDGTHTLAFNGLNPGDHTAFVSGVSITEVPEPASLLLLGAGIGLVRRRFRQR